MIFFFLYFHKILAKEDYKRVILSEEKILELKENFADPLFDDLFFPIREAAQNIISDSAEFLPPKERFNSQFISHYSYLCFKTSGKKENTFVSFWNEIYGNSLPPLALFRKVEIYFTS